VCAADPQTRRNFTIYFALSSHAQSNVGPSAHSQHIALRAAAAVIIDQAALKQWAGLRVVPPRYHDFD
jgi:hypothetical protein